MKLVLTLSVKTYWSHDVAYDISAAHPHWGALFHLKSSPYSNHVQKECQIFSAILHKSNLKCQRITNVQPIASRLVSILHNSSPADKTNSSTCDHSGLKIRMFIIIWCSHPNIPKFAPYVAVKLCTTAKDVHKNSRSLEGKITSRWWYLAVRRMSSKVGIPLTCDIHLQRSVLFTCASNHWALPSSSTIVSFGIKLYVWKNPFSADLLGHILTCQWDLSRHWPSAVLEDSVLCQSNPGRVKRLHVAPPVNPTVSGWEQCRWLKDRRYLAPKSHL